MKQLLFILLFGLSVFSFSQNLVPNSGFDTIYNSCPTTPSLSLSNIKNWYEYNVCTPEVFYYCKNQAPFWSGIPRNIFGHQYPLSDSIYVGIFLYDVSNINSDYISVKLIEPLKPNQLYCGEFYVSLADSVNYAISSIGMYFSTDSLYSSLICPQYNYTPQIQNDSLNIIKDKENWVKISGQFIAQGGEQFLTIGNFYDTLQTSKNSAKVSNNPLYDFAYYYIDNVSVYACDSPVVEEPQDTTFVFIPNVFSPNQDGENDLWEVIANKVNSLNVQVFNRWGEQVYIFNSSALGGQADSVTYSPAWDGYTPTGKPVPEGTYFYIVQYTLPSGENKVEKGNLSLIR